VIVRLITPTKLTDKQKQILQEFAELTGSSPQGEEEDSFFSKVKRAFKGE
jgi:molecular chaperone DnaJ